MTPHRALRSHPTKDAPDLTDKLWAAIAPPVVTPSPKGGRSIEIDRRLIVNALLDNHRTTRQWRMLPTDVPPMHSIRFSFDPSNRDGTFVTINDMMQQNTTIRLNITEKPPRQRSVRSFKAIGGGTLDCVIDTLSFGEESIQPQFRIKQSLSSSRFYRNAPESALSGMLVF